jgi:hypothetical protein
MIGRASLHRPDCVCHGEADLEALITTGEEPVVETDGVRVRASSGAPVVVPPPRMLRSASWRTAPRGQHCASGQGLSLPSTRVILLVCETRGDEPLLEALWLSAASEEPSSDALALERALAN